jgi:hypothetical protein
MYLIISGPQFLFFHIPNEFQKYGIVLTFINKSTCFSIAKETAIRQCGGALIADKFVLISPYCASL